MIKSKLTSILLTSIFFLLASKNELLAFPELVGKGYKSCQGCHVSPSGGGLLNQYGSMFAAEELSTWGKSREPFLPNWLNIGGDARHLYIINKNQEASFPMVMNLSLGLSPIDGLTFVGQIGAYTRNKRIESHQAYALLTRKLTKSVIVNIRGGKFYPNYGIMTPDHTREIRRAHFIKRDNETLNTEASFISKYFSVFSTWIIGETDNSVDYGLSYKRDFEALTGYSNKIEFYPLKSIRLGYSQMGVIEGIEQKKSQAIHLETGLTKHAYYLGQYDWYFDKQVLMNELGVYAYRGVLLYAVHEGGENLKGGLRFFPYPHLELQAEWRHLEFISQLHYYF